MTINTYATLQTALTTFGGRDFSAYAADLITLGEQRIFFGSEDPEFPSKPLRVRGMEQSTDPTSYVTVAGTATLALPSGFLGFTSNRRFFLSTSPTAKLDFVSKLTLDERYDQNDTDQPEVFALAGDNLVFGPTPDSAYGVGFDYYKKPDPLATTPTNFLLTAAPGIYLYAALLEAQALIRNDARLVVWARMYAAAVGGYMKSDEMDRFSGALVAQAYHDTP